MYFAVFTTYAGKCAPPSAIGLQPLRHGRSRVAANMAGKGADFLPVAAGG